MSVMHDFYEFWVSQQTIPGNIVGDFLIGAATYMVGKYKVAPWLHARHKEQLDQRERQHQELLEAHQELIDLHERHHRELFHRGGVTGEPDGLTSPPPP